VTITHPDARPYHFVYPPHLADWPPLVALRAWLTEEIAASQHALEGASRPRRGRANGNSAPKPRARAPDSVD
jgi:LysR family glycine cleavage system transcriptional activator